ncbi:chitinase-3-like protein 1 [Plakobranchus ocellatus]|uniref:Chitinase-3-like protein 1 n=1 Tax=Plakobranchus ocellatus TaxID=259542 RepID=A0AAV3Y8V7_9GAST|nr:chitinase-3-like protein 1 [Plakobranchus ocellatus]
MNFCFQSTSNILPARWQSNPKYWCVLEFGKTNSVQLCSVLSDTFFTTIHLLTSRFWSDTMISSREDASVIRERDIRAAQQYHCQRTLSRGSETLILAAPRSRHADVAKSYNFLNAQCARSYANA